MIQFKWRLKTRLFDYLLLRNTPTYLTELVNISEKIQGDSTTQSSGTKCVISKVWSAASHEHFKHLKNILKLKDKNLRKTC